MKNTFGDEGQPGRFPICQRCDLHKKLGPQLSKGDRSMKVTLGSDDQSDALPCAERLSRMWVIPQAPTVKRLSQIILISNWQIGQYCKNNGQDLLCKSHYDAKIDLSIFFFKIQALVNKYGAL